MALSRESTTYPRWISRASSGSGVRNKRKRTPIQCFCGCAKKKRVCCQLAILRTGVRGGKKVCVSSVIFLCERANTPQTLTIFFNVSGDNKKTRVSRYVAAASSASSASMTALSPPMSRITCVGCAAPGGAGVPAGFTHTDARSAASTPPCGGGGAKRRKKRRQSRRARFWRVGSARRRTPRDERSRERRNAWARGFEKGEKEEEPLLSVTRALPVRPSRASRRRARLRLARTPRRDTP